MKYVHLTEEHLVPLRQYIYNIVCEFKGTVCEQALSRTLFSRENIEERIANGMHYYGELLRYERTIVEECEHSNYMHYDSVLRNLGYRQTMATKHNEQALRILLHFNVENNVYKCTYLNESLQQQTIEIERELVEDEICNMEQCEQFETKLYEQVLNVQEHTRALIFFHALGMHKHIEEL